MLSQILARRPAASIDQVVQIMSAIDANLPENDGLKWFNRLHRLCRARAPGTQGLTAPHLPDCEDLVVRSRPAARGRRSHHAPGRFDCPAGVHRYRGVRISGPEPGAESRVMSRPAVARAWRYGATIRRSMRLMTARLSRGGQMKHQQRIGSTVIGALGVIVVLSGVLVRSQGGAPTR